MEEITAEYASTELRAPVEIHATLKLTIGCKTDMGRVRENNEDKYEFFMPTDPQDLGSKGEIFVVCDGMGGHEAGQIASELACKTFIDVYRSHLGEAEAALRNAVAAANRFVHDASIANPSRRGMGTTLSSLVLLQDHGFIAQVGDSRVYRVREGAIEQLTVDHTWVEETVRAGTMSREEAENSMYRHMITRAIGPESDVAPDVFTWSLRAGDTYLLCSDGVTNHVEDPDLCKILEENSPAEAAWKVVGAALVGGGSDNATAIVVHVDDIVTSS